MEPTCFDLTLEQQFQMRLMEQSAENMSQEQLSELLVQVSRLLLLKENVIKSLMNHLPMQPFGYEA